MAAASAAQKGSKADRQVAALDKAGAQKGTNSFALTGAPPWPQVATEGMERDHLLCHGLAAAAMERQRWNGPAAVGGGTVWSATTIEVEAAASE